MSRLEDLEQILHSNFQLTKNDSQIDTESEYLNKLQQALAQRIVFLINTDVEKLFQILYKVDVDQRLTDKAFDLGEIKKISMKVAELIIQRQLKKIDYARSFYKESDS